MRLRAKKSTIYALQHTSGEVVTTSALNSFCTERGLDPRWLRRVIRGTRKSYTGWSVQTPEEEIIVAKKYTFQHRNGEKVEFTSLVDFCRERGLDPRPFYPVLRGERLSHLGWGLVGKQKERSLRVKSPEGEILLVENVRGFALKHGIDPSNLRKLLLGNLKSVKGWKRAGKVFTPTPPPPEPPGKFWLKH